MENGTSIPWKMEVCDTVNTACSNWALSSLNRSIGQLNKKRSRNKVGRKKKKNNNEILSPPTTIEEGNQSPIKTSQNDDDFHEEGYFVEEVNTERRDVPHHSSTYSYKQGFNFLDYLVDSREFPKHFADPLLFNSASEDNKWRVDRKGFRRNALNYMKSLATETMKKTFVSFLSSIFPDSGDLFHTLFDEQVMARRETFHTFHFCSNCNESVFVNQKREDRCTNCNFPRFKPCARCQAPGLCSHYSSRTPHAILQYRSLTSILKHLVTFESFLSALNFNDPSKSKGFVNDLMDTPIAMKHLSEMKLIHDSRRASCEEAKPVYLLLQTAYDGAQVHKSKVTKFSPMMVCILNLPPSYRKLNGVGMFVLSIFTGNEGTGAERFLYVDCFIRELEQFANGIPAVGGDGESLMIYARLISHCYDTKAMEKMLQFRAVTSKSPCVLCRSVKGTRSKELHKVVFEGGRVLLPLDHFLRSKGQYENCCPEGYYTKDDVQGEVIMLTNTKFDNDGKIRSCSVLQNNSARNLRSCELSSDGEREIIETLNRRDKSFVWFHESVMSYTIFAPHVFYKYCDYRRFLPYRRISNEVYLADGTKARSSVNKGNVNGLSGVWYFSRLHYSDIETQVCWDPFHSLKAVAKSLLDLLCDGGKNINTPMILKFFQESLCHPCLSRPSDETLSSSSSLPITSLHPWKLLDKTREHLDASFACILFPLGYSDFCKIVKPFEQGGNLIGVSLIQLFTNFSGFFILGIRRLLSSYPAHFLAFFKLFSDALCKLQQPRFNLEEIDLLYKCIVEVVELHHGLFPLVEATFMWHELVDIVQYIKLFGPISGWWTLPAERMISAVKRFLPKGGQKYYKTVMTRFTEAAMQETENFYTKRCSSSDEKNLKSLKKGKENGFINYSSDDNGRKTILQSNYIMKLKSTKEFQTLLSLGNLHEHNSLLQVIIHEIWKAVGGDMLAALAQSRLIRLYLAFRAHKKLLSNPANITARNKIEFNFVNYLRQMRKNIAPSLKDLKLVSKQNPTVMEPIEIFQHVGRAGVFSYDIGNDGDVDILQQIYGPVSSLFYPRAFEKAHIYGMHFSSRDPCKREMNTLVSSKEGPTNEANNLTYAHLRAKNEVSSWFRFRFFSNKPWVSFEADIDNKNRGNVSRHHPSYVDDIHTSHKDHVGQFNTFFRLDIPSEPLVHNTPFASAVCRTFTEETMNINTPGRSSKELNVPHSIPLEVLKVDCTVEGSSLLRYRRTSDLVLFVPLSDVYSNPLAVVPIDCKENNEIPINIKSMGEEKGRCKLIIYLIGLYPSRKCLVYERDKAHIFRDISGDSRKNDEEEEDDEEDDEEIIIEFDHPTGNSDVDKK